MTDDTMIAALLREREGYVQRGLDDRVKQVDEQLKLRGYTLGEGSGKQGSGQASDRSAPPKDRRTPRKNTT